MKTPVIAAEDLSDLLARIEGVVNEMQQEIISLLQDLVRIPSENPPGSYIPISQYLDKKLTELGFEVTLIEVPGNISEAQGLTGPRINITARLKGNTIPNGENQKTLIYNSHIDTVPAGDPLKWRFPPFEAQIHEGRIYGRGATDSKGRLTAYIMAAVALKRSGLPFAGDIIIAATCDEETGGTLGAGYVLNNGHLYGDAVIVEGYSNQIIRATAGVLQLRISAFGKAAHSGFKWKGINAIEKMATLIRKLDDFQRELHKETSQVPGMKYTTINVGTIKGGDKINVVPDYCEMDVDFRIIPEHSKEIIFSCVRAIIDDLTTNDPEISFQIEKLPGFETEPTLIDADAALIHLLQQSIITVAENKVPVGGMMAQTDLRWFLQKGMMGINYGPGTSENNLHGYDEFMEIADLLQTTKILSHFTYNMFSNG